MIRKLTASASQVKALVAIGANEWGGTVTVEVVLPRNAEAVQTAITALEELCLTEAQTFVRTSRDRGELDRLVRDGVDKRLARERTRIETNAKAEVEGRVRWLEREKSDLRERVSRMDAEMDRLRAQLKQAQEPQQEGPS